MAQQYTAVMFTLQQACGSYSNVTNKQYSSSGMSFYFLFGALQTLPLALSPLNNPSMMLELKCQLLFRTVELQIESSLKCSLVQCAQKPVTCEEWKFNKVHRSQKWRGTTECLSHDPHVKENTLLKQLSCITNLYVHVCIHMHIHTHTKQGVNAIKFQKISSQNKNLETMQWNYQIKDSAVDTDTNFSTHFPAPLQQNWNRRMNHTEGKGVLWL